MRMGSLEEMTSRIEEKVNAGFRCIKLKIGALDWAQEEGMISAVRRRFSPEELEIRVDANGGFPMDSALPRLKWLADMGIHSIEQPIPAGNRELMAFLCSTSPLPIALDEELIGISATEDKIRILDEIKPAYIILKPALCGGFSGASEWIDLAVERGIGWWITSSLESNVGLNALAQFTASLNTAIPQGLGTGNLFTDNFPSPLSLDSDRLAYNPETVIDRSVFDNLGMARMTENPVLQQDSAFERSIVWDVAFQWATSTCFMPTLPARREVRNISASRWKP